VGLTIQQSGHLSSTVAEILNHSHLSTTTLLPLSTASLLAAQNALISSGRCGEMPFQPVIDGDLLPAAVLPILQEKGPVVDVMIGYNKDEDLLFERAWPHVYRCKTEEDLVDLVSH